MARIYTRTMANYFQKKNINTWQYVKDGLTCWSKSRSDFDCKVECPYNERKAECACHMAVSKDALEYINELEEKLADVVPKSEVERLQKENAELLLSETTDIHLSMESLINVRVEHPIFKAIEGKVAWEIFDAFDKAIGSCEAWDHLPAVLLQLLAELKTDFLDRK